MMPFGVYTAGGVDHGVWGPPPENMSEFVLTPQNVTFFHPNLLLDNTANVIS